MPVLPGMQIVFVGLGKFSSSPLARKDEVIELQVMSVRDSFRTWPRCPTWVRYRGQSGLFMLGASISLFGPSRQSAMDIGALKK
jgi:hypothetical protein